MFQGIPKKISRLLGRYYDSQYEDKVIISQLMAKALMFKSRRKFIDTVKFEFIADSKVIESLYRYKIL